MHLRMLSGDKINWLGSLLISCDLNTYLNSENYENGSHRQDLLIKYVRLMIRVLTFSLLPYTASKYSLAKLPGRSPSLKPSHMILALSSGEFALLTESTYKDFSTSYAFHFPFKISSHSLELSLDMMLLPLAIQLTNDI